MKRHKRTSFRRWWSDIGTWCRRNLQSMSKFHQSSCRGLGQSNHGQPRYHNHQEDQCQRGTPAGRRQGLGIQDHRSSQRASWHPKEWSKLGRPWQPSASRASRCLCHCSCWGRRFSGKPHLHTQHSRRKHRSCGRRCPCLSTRPRGTGCWRFAHHQPRRNPWRRFSESNQVQSTQARHPDPRSTCSCC